MGLSFSSHLQPYKHLFHEKVTLKEWGLLMNKCAKVTVSNDQEMVQSERNFHSENKGRKKKLHAYN